MKLRYFPRTRTAVTTALLLGAMVMAGSALASAPVPVTTTAGKYITVTKAAATVEADGLHIEGALQSRHFTPRRPIAGVVMVMIHDAEGNVIQEKELHSESLFVPKGIRQVDFSGVLDGSIPDGGYVTVTSVN